MGIGNWGSSGSTVGSCELRISRQAIVASERPHFNAEGAENMAQCPTLVLAEMENDVSRAVGKRSRRASQLLSEIPEELRNIRRTPLDPGIPASSANLRDLRVKNCGVVNGSNP